MPNTPNVSMVDLADGRRVCFSYGVPVAAFVPDRGYIVTNRKYSVTTSRHANQFTGKGAAVVPDSELRRVILPLVGGDR
jgi:hypothetical protein